MENEELEGHVHTKGEDAADNLDEFGEEGCTQASTHNIEVDLSGNAAD